MTERKLTTRTEETPRGEAGVALIVALLAMTVIAGLGFTLLVSSSTESLINANFRRAGLAHYAAMGGLEEMRGRMGPDALPTNSLATTVGIPCSDNAETGSCPPLFNLATNTANLNRGYYILKNNTIDPRQTDCRDLGVSCFDPNAPASVVFFPTTQPGTAPYAWVKVTLATQRMLKRNLAAPCNTNDPLAAGYCDPATLDNARMICWDGFSPIVGDPTLPTPYSNCGDPVSPLYIYTALSIQPGGATRVVREVAVQGKLPNLPGGLILNGCPSIYPPPASHPYQISGIDSGSGGDDQHAITVRCQADMELIHNLITDDPNCKPPPKGNGGTYTVNTPNRCQQGPNLNPRYPGIGNNNCSNPNCNNTNFPNSADIFNGSALLNANPYFKDCTGMQRLVAQVRAWADYTYPAGATSLMTNGSNTAGDGSNSNPDLWNRVVNVIAGDANLSQADFGNPGAGIILVEGNLSVTGYPSYNGVILVIGTGNMTVSGGGNGTLNGGIFLANTSMCSTTDMLGPVNFSNPGGGTFNLNYNSDAVKPKQGFLPVQRLSLNY